MFLGYDAVNVKCDKVTTLALPHPKKTILLLKLQHSIDCFMLFFHDCFMIMVLEARLLKRERTISKVSASTIFNSHVCLRVGLHVWIFGSLSNIFVYLHSDI